MADHVEPEPTAQQPSQTAQDYINAQLELEKSAREALPYSFDVCTKSLGPIRQLVFACLTCTPAGTAPAGMCYSCSISCHGSHGDLVELFTKRNFVCDCGTTRFPDSHCLLRKTQEEEPAATNSYNQNYKGKFCEDELYEAEMELGTMYQCMLGDVCGEDWFHDACVVGSKPQRRTTVQDDVAQRSEDVKESDAVNDTKVNSEDVTEHERQPGDLAQDEPVARNVEDEEDEDYRPLGIPKEEDFEHFICWKCVDANPWLRRYAGAPGFLDAVVRMHNEGNTPLEVQQRLEPLEKLAPDGERNEIETTSTSTETIVSTVENSQKDLPQPSKKRKSIDDHGDEPDSNTERLKRLHVATATSSSSTTPSSTTLENALLTTTATVTDGAPCTLPPLTTPLQISQSISLFLKEDFRSHLCHCASCFPLLSKFPVLLEEEETYEPPLDSDNDGNSTTHESLFDAGERALGSMDRVKAIEGVMAYNTLKEKVRAFLQPFAEENRVVQAEDVKKYFGELSGL